MPITRSGFFNKVPGQSFFMGQQIYLWSWLCFVRCIFLIFFHFFYVVVSSVFKGRRKCAMLYFWRPSGEIRDRLIGKITMFSDEIFTKPGQIQSCKFSFSLFDQVSFRSNVVSIKCGFDRVSFRSNGVLIVLYLCTNTQVY